MLTHQTISFAPNAPTQRAPCHSRADAGFTLLELLVVVVLISIITAIAVPNIIAARRSANEASAIESCRVLIAAQTSYFSSHDQYAPSISDLMNEKLIDEDLGSGSKNGYLFTESSMINMLGGSVVEYEYYADPFSSTTGSRHFYVDSKSSVIYSRLGGVACPTCPGSTPLN